MTKNKRRSFIFITFLSIKNSGRDKPTVAIINASHVPRGTPLAMSDWIIGMTLVAFAYMGTHRSTANGTAKMLSLPIYHSKNHTGTNPWIPAQIPTQRSTYGNTFLVISHHSLVASFRICLQFFSWSCCWKLLSGNFRMKSATCDSNFSFHNIRHPTIPSNTPPHTYKRVVLIPKSDKNIAIATSLTSGEVIKKANVTPSGILAFKNQMNSGIDEQLQKGVIAPNSEAKRYSSQNSLFFARNSCIFCIGNNIVTKLMICVIRTSITKILSVS